MVIGDLQPVIASTGGYWNNVTLIWRFPNQYGVALIQHSQSASPELIIIFWKYKASSDAAYLNLISPQEWTAATRHTLPEMLEKVKSYDRLG